MTPEGLVALRLSATLAHALPGVRLRLRHGRRTLLEVAPPSWSVAGAITPCAFRGAVAQAHRRLQDGQRLRFLGLAEGCSPTVDVAVRPTDRILAGGILRVAVGGTRAQAFATTLEPRACRGVLADGAGPALDVALHHDAGTDVTVVHCTEPDGADGRSLLDELLVRCFARELDRELAPR